MTPEERTAHLRSIARKGGQATYGRYGREHMVTIGKRGFEVALDLGWGEWLWRTKLSLTYEVVMGHPRPEQPSERTREGQRVRAAARRLYPQIGRCAWPGCTAPAEHRHHARGVRVPDANDHVVEYCADHHRQVERDQHRSRGRGETQACRPAQARDEKEKSQ